jgi:hypothetical protein
VRSRGCVFKFVFGFAAYGDDPQAAANYPLVRITNNRTGHVFYSRTHDHTSRLLHLALSGLLISMCPQPKSGPTKLDNTQTGLIEILQLDLVCFDIRVLADGKFN